MRWWVSTSDESEGRKSGECCRWKAEESSKQPIYSHGRGEPCVRVSSKKFTLAGSYGALDSQ